MDKVILSIKINDYESGREEFIGVVNLVGAVEFARTQWDAGLWKVAARYGDNRGVSLVMRELDENDMATGELTTIDLAPEYETTGYGFPCDHCGKSIDDHFDAGGSCCGGEHEFENVATKEAAYKKFLEDSK